MDTEFGSNGSRNLFQYTDRSGGKLVDFIQNNNLDTMDFAAARDGHDCTKVVNGGSSSWFPASAIVMPMAFVTVAMFLLDCLQRMFPHNSPTSATPSTTIDTDSRWKSQLAQMQMMKAPPKPKRKPPPPSSANMNMNNANKPAGQTSIRIGTVFGQRSDPFKHSGKRKVFPGKRKRKLRIFPKYSTEYSDQLNPYLPRFESILDSIPKDQKTIYNL